MQIHMFNAIFQRLFQNVSFEFIEGNADMDIKNDLMQRWFKTQEWIGELEEQEDHAREFYSRNVIARICGIWRNALRNIFENLGDDLCHVLAEKKCRPQENPYSKLLQVEWEIRRNLVEILANNNVEQYAMVYMQIYREAYADIASILTGGISPDIYKKAFQESQELISNAPEKDILRELRIYIVAETVTNCEGIAYKEEWKEYRDKHDPQKKSECTNEEEKSNTTGNLGKLQDQSGNFWIQETDLEAFKEILGESGNKLWEKLGRKNDFFEKFRAILEEMNMINILSGKVNQELMILKESVEPKYPSGI